MGSGPNGSILQNDTNGVRPQWYYFLKFALLTQVGVFEAQKIEDSV